jgi:hypothetical protein
MGLFDSLVDTVLDLPRKTVELTGDVVDTTVRIPGKVIDATEKTAEEADRQARRLMGDTP